MGAAAICLIVLTSPTSCSDQPTQPVPRQEPVESVTVSPATLSLTLPGSAGTLTAAVLGYVLEERRGRIGAGVLFVLLSLYVGVIADLNRPTSGNIREAQDAMLMLQASLKSQPPEAFDRYRTEAAR
jgi:hypothetical protein